MSAIQPIEGTGAAAASLFTPLQIREVAFRNRVAVSPLCQYSADDGFANDWHLVHLGSRAVGGAGLVMVEATAVEPEGRISPEDVGIWKDEHIEPLARISRFITAQGAAAGIQLAHAGRKASTPAPWRGGGVIRPEAGGWHTVAPSPIPFQQGGAVPRELAVSEIRSIVDAFRRGAERAREAGFQVAEIHAAHGYLIHQFLSPLSNQRTDEYGGSFENRIRLARETAQAIRTVWPERLPLFIRISATDWAEGGWDVDQSVELARRLREWGVDLVDCSSGGATPDQRITVGPGYQVPFAERIRREAGVLTAAVGLITTAEQASEIVSCGQADMVLLGREMLRDPYFAIHAARLLQEQTEIPVQYLRAFTR
jgi:2,4-dienoyl-CoA reductase-like NADH-dependent reductase (Old Yellow Enzyme family)